MARYRGKPSAEAKMAIQHVKSKAKKPVTTKTRVGHVTLIICVLGIYASFLTWAILQERISTTPYGADLRVFRGSYVISGVQSVLSCISGLIFMRYKRQTSIWPRDPALLKKYALIAACQSLSSPLSYSSLRYVDYVTMLLAKSCKLLPVMAVHLLLYRRRFPNYKYVVVILVTAGVSIFSLYQATTKKSSNIDPSMRTFGLLLLGSSLFLDGLYNTTQDSMFQQFHISGPQMMVVMNALTAVFGFGGLILSSQQLEEVVWFARNHPAVYRDIAMFGMCGALGQLFVFYTLEKFGSLVLVTTTVTRKMISMLLSVVMFNHKLKPMQWVGVLLVFGGIGGESLYKLMK